MYRVRPEGVEKVHVRLADRRHPIRLRAARKPPLFRSGFAIRVQNAKGRANASIKIPPGAVEKFFQFFNVAHYRLVQVFISTASCQFFINVLTNFSDAYKKALTTGNVEKKPIGNKSRLRSKRGASPTGPFREVCTTVKQIATLTNRYFIQIPG